SDDRSRVNTLASGRGVLRKSSGSGSVSEEAVPLVRASLETGGERLNADNLDLMRSRFGHDFSRVRVHAGENAARAAQSISARAFTVGPDIVFGTSQYVPGTPRGQRLLAHELTHIVQQGLGSSRSTIHRDYDPKAAGMTSPTAPMSVPAPQPGAAVQPAPAKA